MSELLIQKKKTSYNNKLNRNLHLLLAFKKQTLSFNVPFHRTNRINKETVELIQTIVLLISCMLHVLQYSWVYILL